MADPFIGELKAVGFNFAPRGWAVCDGQLIDISDNTALFSLLGDTYGGNAQTNFGLPDMRGRCAISAGTGPGLTPIYRGGMGGVQTVTLSQNNLPAHNHQIAVSGNDGNTTDPANAIPANVGDADFSGTVPSGIPVTGTVKVGTKDGTITSAQTSETRNISGNVTAKPYTTGVPTHYMNAAAVSNTGGTQSFVTHSPFVGVLYIMAMLGLYPSRN